MGEGGSAKPHHNPAGGFRNPWETAPTPRQLGFRSWLRAHRAAKPFPPDPPHDCFPRADPSFDTPRANPNTITITWVGQSTFLIQIGGVNVLTDPVWSDRVVYLPIWGKRRWMPPGISFDDLPPIDVVLLSHDHYDHCDGPTLRRIARQHDRARWIVPLGVGDVVRARGARTIVERDWWDAAMVGPVRFTATPAQHHSGRKPGDRFRTLWSGWVISDDVESRPTTSAHPTRRIYFAGDTAWFPAFGDIAERCGPFDVLMLPIGGYHPNAFMRYVHTTPEEALQVYATLNAVHPGDDGLFVPMHWGTFKLSDEPMDEPPERLRRAWAMSRRDERLLWVPRHGETRRSD